MSLARGIKKTRGWVVIIIKKIVHERRCGIEVAFHWESVDEDIL
jgi:hypothetical protein